MVGHNYPLSFRIANMLHKRFFSLYNPLYFLYKKSSDRDAIEVLRKVVKRGMTAADIGANIGFYTVLLSRLVGDTGKVYSFEPESLNFSYLQHNSRGLGNVCVNKMAVGEKTGRIPLFYSDELNVDHHTYDDGEKRAYAEVECTSIDDYFVNDRKLDFVKIDIQGYDYHAVLGMEKTIKKSDGMIIFGELWPYGLKKAGVEPSDYLELLRSMSFDIQFLGHVDTNDIDKMTDDKFYYKTFLALRR